MRIRTFPLTCLLVLLSGCGTKITEANYYQIGVGTSEGRVEELLGPGKVVAVPEAPAGSNRVAKRWEAEGLKITILFENDKVIARNAEGLSSGTESYDWPDAATRPALPEGRPRRDQ
jgi:hypothetical protein